MLIIYLCITIFIALLFIFTPKFLHLKILNIVLIAFKLILMGIKKLMSLLVEKAPNSIRRCDLEMFSGRIVACDASMVLTFSIKNSIYS